MAKPTPKEIVAFMHCKSCFHSRPGNQTPGAWQNIEAGWTEKGFQVWCKRCDKNMVSLDFQGAKHPVH